MKIKHLSNVQPLNTALMQFCTNTNLQEDTRETLTTTSLHFQPIYFIRSYFLSVDFELATLSIVWSSQTGKPVSVMIIKK